MKASASPARSSIRTPRTPAPEGALASPDAAFAQSPLDGQAVVLGIRPEDLSAALQPGGHHLQARVRLVEPMGPNQVLWLQAGAQQLGLTSDSALAAPAGTEVYVTLAAQRISLFNPSTQDRL